MSTLIFDKYDIVRRLALGGMGEVFLARQTGVAGFDRLVILKSLLPELAEQEGFVDQFLDEARVAATLNHPNIVAIYEVGLWNGVYFIAMEYIHGDDLARLARAASRDGEPMPLAVAARVIHDAALGLHHAHSAKDLQGRALGIVHRDISPQNIMVRSDGVTKVVDFGIAKAANRSTRTATGLLKGKLQYMPPEQMNNEAVDGRSDQWSLGVVLWELTCQRRLFKGENDIETLRHVLTDPIPAPSSVVPGYPLELDAVVMRMLQRDPALRYPTCEEVALGLKQYLDTTSLGVGEDRVAHFVQNRMGQELEERTKNLTPSTGTNFLLHLGTPSPALPSGGAPQAETARASALPTWALPVVGGGAAALLLLLVALGWMWTAESASPPPPAAPSVALTPKDTAPALPPEGRAPPDAPPAPPPALPPVLTLRSEPSGASVWVGGRLVGETPLDMDFLAADVEQEISVVKRGYRDEKLRVRLVAGERKEDVVRLTRRAPAASSSSSPSPPSSEAGSAAERFGQLTLQTTPWAKVDIDGAPYGSTPLWKQKLAPGVHKVRLTNEEAGIDVTKTIEIKPGSHVKKRMKLP